ncbi:glycosyl transferase [Chloroflexus islandicus]|uniref:Glycosyl transferase n=1 Tax=Chloroflexus islandicus TaxID=1707952 RepID=A0A178M3Y7_9CHLR|nr:transglycosylase domain-containing protein [Chloroflexus islandicus]OAN42683.1 glycosyl transferase [Chloroflexus islandicus]
MIRSRRWYLHGRNGRNGRNGRRHVPPRLLRGRPAPRPVVGRLVLNALLAVLGLIAVVLIGLAGFAYNAYMQVAESLKPRLALLDNRELFENSRIFDRNGELLYEFFDAGKRTKVAIDEISPLLIQATIAIEDKTFYTNPGIDLAGIIRTLVDSLRAGEETGGASTITQQVIKNSVLTPEERLPERRYERKLKEIILAQELDRIYSKDQILELYLNENFYGNLAYGIQAASEVYFGVSAAELDLNQASLLAGLPQLPSVYNPINYLERDEQGGYLPPVFVGDDWLDPAVRLPAGTPLPRARQAAVLRRMVEDGYITEAQARRALATPLRFAPQEAPLNAPHFVFYVRDLLLQRYGAQIVYGGGLRITTTLDLQLQRMAQATAFERIAELESRNIHNAAVVIMQPNTGQILAMVGSIDYNAVKPTKTPGESGNVLDGQVNVATRERQPGSALKPFTYLAAMEQGMTPESVLWDVPTQFPTGTGGWYAPQNYNGQWNGPVRIRTSLANSLNMPAVKALKFAGIDYTLGLLERVGIRTGLKRGAGFYGLSLTLGGGEVSPLELTTAYNTLASGGKYFAPVAILEITDSQGRTLERFTQTPGEEVVDPALVAIISDMLSDDRARQAIWGLNSPLRLSLPAAVKTGTTNDWRDAWAAGYTPFVTVGVWTGNNNNEPTARVESLTGGGIIWRNVMENIFRLIREDERYRELFAAPFPDGEIPTNFTLPENVVRRPICELPGPFGGYREELFTEDMLKRLAEAAAATPTPTANPTGLLPVEGICSAYDRVTVVRIPTPEEWTSTGELRPNPPPAPPTDPKAPPLPQDLSALSDGAYCRPAPEASYPPELVRTIYLWKLPPPDPDEKVEYKWRGGDATVQLKYEDIPECTAEMFKPPVPVPPVEGAILMPDLRRLGENQAKEVLALLGIDPSRIYVDYQGPDRAGEDYFRYGPYVVLSSLPAAGEWILPDTIIVLGIRAPDPEPAPQPAPEPPPPAPDS